MPNHRPSVMYPRTSDLLHPPCQSYNPLAILERDLDELNADIHHDLVLQQRYNEFWAAVTEDEEFRRRALTQISLKQMVYLARFGGKRDGVKQRAAQALMHAAGLLDRKTDRREEQKLEQYDLIRLVRERAEKLQNEQHQAIESSTREVLELTRKQSKLREQYPISEPSKYAGLTVKAKKSQ